MRLYPLLKSMLMIPMLAGSIAAYSDVTIVVNTDRGEDIGQNFGSLFEARTKDGAFVLGAGFSGAYNTKYRHDRHTVHFYVRPTGESRELQATTLPRPGELAGNYLFNFDGKVYATYPDVRVWDESDNAWNPSPTRNRVDTRVGNDLLSFDSGTVVLNGKTVLPAAKEGNYTGFYYAQGYLVFYHIYRPGEQKYRSFVKDEEGYSKLYACPWRPGVGAVDLDKATIMTVPVVGEFPYAYGQLGNQVVSCSNIGGVYALRDGRWRTLVDGSMKTSYQVYAGFTYYDQLLLGQYPTGELFSFDGESVERIEGWPPVIEGVSGSAREAQTVVVYGGELYVGVWPWGEVWRYHRELGEWSLARRMFTHPALTNATTHPYELECKALGGVANQWGQRVTSMVPLNDSLLISTSAKWPSVWEAKFDFLGNDAWKEYGAVTRLYAPGHLSVPLKWTDGPTELRFTLANGIMRVEQDGDAVGSATLSASVASAPESASHLDAIDWGQGAYGIFAGDRVDGATVTP
ncbi:MAG: hypothetical protein L3K26_05425 [Candidatus Hydrogenedentes bacterium]|nr:hypothetical protein [Candidatus Hydrogenedentota bacterium]